MFQVSKKIRKRTIIKVFITHNFFLYNTTILIREICEIKSMNIKTLVEWDQKLLSLNLKCHVNSLEAAEQACAGAQQSRTHCSCIVLVKWSTHFFSTTSITNLLLFIFMLTTCTGVLVDEKMLMRLWKK